MFEPPHKRLRSKTLGTPRALSPRPSRQADLPEPLELDAQDEQPQKKCRSYLVTFPHPQATHSACGVKLVAPGTLRRSEIGARILAACRNPMYQDVRNAHLNTQVELSRLSIFREYHTAAGNGPLHTHYHAPLVAGGQVFRFAPIKLALLKRFGLASHWSCTHTGYWSALRYCAVPSPKKPAAALDPSPWLWPVSHPILQDACNEPVTAKAMEQRRWALTKAAAEAGSAEARITELDVWAVVVRAGIENKDDDKTADMQLFKYAREHCTAKMVEYLFKNRAKLSAMIDDIWRFEKVESLLAEARASRIDDLAKAKASACTCEGKWISTVVGAFIQNGIPITEVCYDLYCALRDGRGETTPVIVFAGAHGGEGKSMFLKGLVPTFGSEFIFKGPVKGNYPFLGIDGSKVSFLDEWRFDEKVIPWSVQCLWYEGSPVPSPRPKTLPARLGT